MWFTFSICNCTGDTGSFVGLLVLLVLGLSSNI
ncbi:hypothetical protein FG877_10565 [Enterococcus casseliflavus]|nr:hypothetical protein [Enterococcus casseliflavus]